jgi:alpha-tubulin suppressor-like RCC1 family protein
MLTSQTQTSLVAWGADQHGQLGHGRKQRSEVTSPTPVVSLNGSPLSAAACGHFHSAVVTAGSMEVHTWGRGALGLLGHGDEEDCLQPRLVRALSGLRIRSVACGAYQTAALTESGELFGWGWRLEKAGGGSVVEGYTTLPERIHALQGLKVRHVACGHYCAAATTTDGALFTWGKGDRGQLGHGHPRDVVAPERVRGGALDGAFVWTAEFGHHFMLALTATGELCSCGAADGAVLGRGSRSGGVPGIASAYALADEFTPRHVGGLQGIRVSAIACGENHCAVLSTEGEVYTWGSSAYGKLGHDDGTDVPMPTAVPMLRGKRFVEVTVPPLPIAVHAHACGSQLACTRIPTLTRTCTRALTRLGLARHPCFSLVFASQVACGSHCTLALTDGGQLFSWGARSAQASPPSRLRLGGAACTLAAGGGHCLAATGDYPVTHASDLALARTVGFEPPATRAAIPHAVADQLGPLSAVVEARVPPDADPAVVLRELQELRGLLAHEEARRDAVNTELMELQQQLQQVLVDEEMLRERRGGVEPPSEPPLHKGVALVDSTTYASMLPDEQVELNLFGFKVAVAVASNKSP